MLLQVELPSQEQIQLFRVLDAEPLTVDFLIAATACVQDTAKAKALETMEAVDAPGIAAALILAGAGVPVLQQVGVQGAEPEILKALGLTLPKTEKAVYRHFQEEGIVFIVAERFYPHYVFLAEARAQQALAGKSSLFDVLEPLAHPFRPRYQVIEVETPKRLSPVGEALLLLGRQGFVCSKGQVVHAARAKVNDYALSPAALGLKGEPHAQAALTPAQAAGTVLHILSGEASAVEQGPVLLQALMGALAYQPFLSAEEALAKVMQSIENGAALRKLQRLQSA